MNIKRALPPLIFAALLGVLAWFASPSPEADAAGGQPTTIACPGPNCTIEMAGLAAAGVTGTTGGSANPILTTTGAHRSWLVSYSLNQDTFLSFNGTGVVFLPAASSGGYLFTDFATNYLILPAGTVIGVYARSSLPTTGFIYVTGF